MGYELFASFIGFVLLPLILGGFVLFWSMTNHERAELENAWESYAERRGRTYVGAHGEWPNRTSPHVTWSRDGARFQLLAFGREGNPRTRLVASPNAKLLGWFVVVPRDGAAPVPREGAFDPFFDTTFRILERPSGLSARVLDVAARRALLAFRQGDHVTVSYRRGKISLEWPGREMSEARLDEAERVVETLACAIERAFAHPRAA